jgi:hypothetical protein
LLFRERQHHLAGPGGRLRGVSGSRARNGLLEHLRIVLMAACAAVLVWLIIWRSFANYLAERAPEDALILNSHEPTALVSLANQQLNAVEAPQYPVPAGEFAENALLPDPLNPRAIRILGQLADYAKDNGRAESLMALAARYSLGESAAVAWMLQKSLKTNNYAQVMYYADVLLRSRPQISEYILRELGNLAENKDASGELKKLLDTNPPWRSYFFALLPTSVRDARTPLNFLLSLRDSSNPPTNMELGPYLQALIDHKLYELAYYTWLQFLPQTELGSAGFLFNGNFELAPSGLPFDWTLVPGSGVTIDRVRMPEQSQGRALFIDFQYGRVDYHSIRQMVMLAPGTYQFSARYKGDLAGPRGLKWRIGCVDGATPVGESPMIIGKTEAWKDIDISFTVPQGSCRPQMVKLDLDSRMASEQLITGSIWFENARLVRTDQ